MTPDLLNRLKTTSAEIRFRWEALLRAQRVTGPLANPDALVHLIPDTMPQVFAFLANGGRSKVTFMEAMADRLPCCDCGNNPYLAYFVAGEQAVVEAVVLAQAKLPPGQRTEGDVAEAIRAVRTLARTEIDTFCGVCAHRCKAAKCRFATVCAN